MLEQIPIIDTHVHLCDPQRFTYRWGEEAPAHLRRCMAEDVFAAVEAPQLRGFVFVEAAASWSDIRAEVGFAVEQAKADPRVLGFVAAIDLESGRDDAASIATLAQQPLVRGVRMLSRYAKDERFFLQPEVEAVLATLPGLGLNCEIGVWPRGISDVCAIAERCPDVSFIITHAGKPNIAAGQFDDWARELAALAQCSNVVCKLTGLATLGDDGRALSGEMSRYFAHAYQVFGPRRCMFGSDWPGIVGAVHYRRWIEIIADALGDASSDDLRAVFHDNAVATYRLRLPA